MKKNLKNEIIFDGRVQKDVKILEELASFTVSAVTGKTQTADNRYRNRLTFIRVLYVGEINDHIRNILQQDNMVRIYGKLDSEQYIDRNGKTVYNKILHAYQLNRLIEEDGVYKEVL